MPQAGGQAGARRLRDNQFVDDPDELLAAAGHIGISQISAVDDNGRDPIQGIALPQPSRFLNSLYFMFSLCCYEGRNIQHLCYVFKG